MDKMQKLRNELKAIIEKYGSENVDVQLERIEPRRTEIREHLKMIKEMTHKQHVAEYITFSTIERFLKCTTSWILSYYRGDGDNYIMTSLNDKYRNKQPRFIFKGNERAKIDNYLKENGWIEDNEFFRGDYNSGFTNPARKQSLDEHEKRQRKERLESQQSSYGFVDVKPNTVILSHELYDKLKKSGFFDGHSIQFELESDA